LKGFLIDQKIVRGIGNTYADEILWENRIAPESLCGKLPEEVVSSLFEAIREVLTEGVRQLEERHPDAIKGEFREFLKIHNPDQKLSPTGKAILRKTIASKTIYFSEDQVVYS
jgi:formamidopyrimidine-DNA glycosylase